MLCFVVFDSSLQFLNTSAQHATAPREEFHEARPQTLPPQHVSRARVVATTMDAIRCALHLCAGDAVSRVVVVVVVVDFFFSAHRERPRWHDGWSR